MFARVIDFTDVNIVMSLNAISTKFDTTVRTDAAAEVADFHNGDIPQRVLRQRLSA